MANVRVSLFITCLVDQFYPQVAESMVTVLRRLGVSVAFNSKQTCCGQPAFNTGYRRYAVDLGKRLLDVFADAEYVVAPSGSCTSMVKHCYDELFTDDPARAAQAHDLAARIHEFSDFLVNVLGVEDVGASYHGRVTYHDACHLLRELGLSQEPRKLVKAVRGIEFVELDDADQCCGFGGTFSVKLSDVSRAMVQDKLEAVERSGADVVVACDSSCLMQMAGASSRLGLGIRTMHLAELLAMRE